MRFLIVSMNGSNSLERVVINHNLFSYFFYLFSICAFKCSNGHNVPPYIQSHSFIAECNQKLKPFFLLSRSCSLNLLFFSLSLLLLLLALFLSFVCLSFSLFFFLSIVIFYIVSFIISTLFYIYTYLL